MKNNTEAALLLLAETAKANLPTHDGCGDQIFKATKILDGRHVHYRSAVRSSGVDAWYEVDRSTEKLSLAEALAKLA
jgi:hypothetical protein